MNDEVVQALKAAVKQTLLVGNEEEVKTKMAAPGSSKLKKSPEASAVTALPAKLNPVPVFISALPR